MVNRRSGDDGAAQVSASAFNGNSSSSSSSTSTSDVGLGENEAVYNLADDFPAPREGQVHHMTSHRITHQKQTIPLTIN